MRSVWTIVHRWAGLFIAVFLFISGATGAVISWDHELDEWLNPHLFKADGVGVRKSTAELARLVEADDPRRRVTFYPLDIEDGHAAQFGVTGRIDPKTKQQYEIGHNQVYIDPVTARINGVRDWGAVGLNSENLMPFLYLLHYSMHIPEMAGIDRWGIWFMGIVGIVWFFDCFVGFYLTLPAKAGVTRSALNDGPPRSFWSRWKPSWQIKRGARGYRLHLDLHRAFGLWFWLLLAIVAFTSISMNIQYEVVRPLLRTFTTLTPQPWELIAPVSRHEPVEPTYGFEEAIKKAEAEARTKGWADPAGYAFYSPDFGAYGVAFYPKGEDLHGEGGIGVNTVLLHGKTGAPVGDIVPWSGTAADIFMQLQFPIHSGRILGIPGRILMSILGIVVAMLSFTGIVIWFKKRAGRRKLAFRDNEIGRASPGADRVPAE